MKYIISLSMKYIRRQRLRTFLTFMCISLSAFILATCCLYGSSLYSTFTNYVKDEDGSWEAEISSWIENAEDPQAALRIVMKHPVVSDHLYYSSQVLMTSSMNERGIHFYEISDGKNTKRLRFIDSNSADGNFELEGKYSPIPHDISKFYDADGVYVSGIFRDMGYKEGDTLTFSLRHVSAEYDESSQIMKDFRAKLREETGTEYTRYDEEYADLSDEQKKASLKTPIFSYLSREMNVAFNDVPIVNASYGKSVEYTIKIAGFYDRAAFPDESLYIINSNSCNVDLSLLAADSPDIYYTPDTSVKIRISDNIDYDEALKWLFTDLGYDYNTDFFNNYIFDIDENSMLLALEWKSSDAISSVIFSFIFPAFLLLLIAWFIARFIIDNAFEMAVQERSTHFAALRIMGASKTQIATLVFTEALFYCLTAIPLGVISAMLLCRSSMNALRHLGFSMFEFSMKPVFLLTAIFLCITAVLISSYTSSMWASRKLSAAEALNFGKPKRKKRRSRSFASKLDLTSKKFLRRYTWKNIKTSKSRFIVSTITMTLGVIMFVSTSLAGIYAWSEYNRSPGAELYDFYISDYYSLIPDETLDEIYSAFGDEEVFNKVHIEISNAAFNWKYDENAADSFKYQFKASKSTSFCELSTIDRIDYERCKLESVIGINYDEFVAQKGAFYNRCTLEYDSEEDIWVDSGMYSFQPVEKETIAKDYYKEIEISFLGTVSSSYDRNNALIIPVENSLGLDMAYTIGLKTNRAHYEEAEKIFTAFTKDNNVMDFGNHFMFVTGMEEFTKAIVKILLTFLVSIWLVGILSMINSVNTSVLNRSRELMMLRSVGMTKKQLRKSVMLETMMFSATSAIAGTALGAGIFLYYITQVMNETRLGIFGGVIVVIVLSIILNIAIAMLSSIPAIKSLERVNSIAQQRDAVS